jgi:hypothetical protein
MFWDVISLIVLLAIGAGFLQALLSMAGPGRNRRRGRTLDDLRDRGPRSFAESGGQPVATRRPPAPQQLQPEGRMRHPAPARPVRRMHTADEPTAEERPRIAPRPTLRPVLRSGARAGQIRRQLNDPRSVRAAFVLREVLDQPLSLRDRG